MYQEANQFGNPGLSFPNALGVAFSQSQVGGQAQSSNIDILSTVTLSLTGDTIFAEPGDSFVDIGESTTGQNVQYITQMAGTTLINSPVMINGDVVLPHQYDFSMNPEGNPSLPTATINANVLVGGAATIGVGTSGTPITSLTTYANAISLNSSNLIANASTITFASSNFEASASTIALSGFSSYLDIDDGRPFIDLVSQQGGIAFTSGSGITSLATTMSNFSSNYISNTTSNYGITARDITFYSSNQYSNYNGGAAILADGGIDPLRVPSVDITSQNGTYGHIGLKAYGGLYGLGYGGDVKIEAFGASNPAVGVGGLIQINAYSGDVGEYGAATSRVSLNAACITLASGAFAPIPGSPGATNVFGQGLVSIVSATLLPVLPQIPQSVYVYGNSGVRFESGSILGVNQGISMLSDMYAGTIYPIANGSNPLIIRGRSSPSAGVQLMDVEKINMVLPNGFITGVSSLNALSLNTPNDISGLNTINGIAYPPPASDATLWSYYPQLSSLSSITAATGILSSLNVSSINGLPIAQPWYTVPAETNVNMNGSTFTNLSTLTVPIVSVSTINGTEYAPTQDWSLYPATSGIDADGNNVGNVGTVFANNLNLTNDFTMTNNDSTANFNNNALTNVSSINGYAFPVPIAPAGSISVSTISVSSIQAIFGTTVNMAGVIINQLDGLFTNSINTPTITGTGFPGPLEIYDASGVILGGIATPVSLIGLSSINGVAYPVTAQNADSLVVSTITVSSIGAVSGGVVNMNGVIINQLNGVFSSNVNTPILTNVGVVGTPLSIYDNDGVIIGAATGPVSLINLSSINGVAYPTAAGWNGNATTNLNMNFNDITTVQNMNTNTLVCVGQVSASNFTTASVAVNTASITIGTTTLDGGGLGATGVTVSYANVSGNVSAASLTNVITINGVKTYSAPNVNQYISVGVTGITYVAVSPGSVNIQSANATGGGDLSVVFRIRDSDNIPGEYRFCNANAVNNMFIQFQTQDPYGNFPNWGGNNQLNPGESILCRCWYNNYQGRYVITNIQKDGNP